MAVTRDIVATYRGPGRVVARLLAMGQREDRALAFVMGFCVIAFVAQLPALARRALRQAADHADQGLGAALCATLGAWLVISLFHDSHFQREYFPLVLCLWGLFLSPTWRMEVSDDGSVAS